MLVYHYSYTLCILESESSDIEEDYTEIWSDVEEDGILSDLHANPSDTALTTDSTLSSEKVESQALAKWIILFLMFIQTTYKLSNTLISVLLKFFHIFLSVLGHYSTVAMSILQCLPSSLYMANKVGN